MDRLTPKQEAFCLAYVETGDASEAYRRAYDASAMSPAAINVEASRLLEHPKITLRLDGLRARLQKRHEITVDSLTGMLKDAYALAMNPEVEAPAAAVSAALGLGRLHGLIVDKKHVTSEDGPKRAVSESERNARLAELLGKLGHGRAAGGETPSADQDEFPILRNLNRN